MTKVRYKIFCISMKICQIIVGLSGLMLFFNVYKIEITRRI